MPDGLPQVQLVIWGMLLAATPATLYAVDDAEEVRQGRSSSFRSRRSSTPIG